MIYLGCVGTKQRIEQNMMGPNPVHLLSLIDSASGCNISQDVVLLLASYLGQATRGCPLVKGALPQLTPVCPGYTGTGAHGGVQAHTQETLW